MLLFTFVAILGFVNCQKPLLGLDEGDICKNEAGVDWICRSVSDCKHVNFKETRPSICSFTGQLPIICCQPPAKRISEKKCRRYNKRFSCERPSNFIWVDEILTFVSGGRPAPPRTYKHMVECKEFMALKCPLATITRKTRDIGGAIFGISNSLTNILIKKNSTVQTTETYSTTTKTYEFITETVTTEANGPKVQGGKPAKGRTHRHMVRLRNAA